MTNGQACVHNMSEIWTPSITNWWIRALGGPKISLQMKRQGCILNWANGPLSNPDFPPQTFLIKWSEKNLAMSTDYWLERVLIRSKNIDCKLLALPLMLSGKNPSSHHLRLCLPQLYLWLHPWEYQKCPYWPTVESTQFCSTNDEIHWNPITNGSVSCSNIKTLQ